MHPRPVRFAAASIGALVLAVAAPAVADVTQTAAPQTAAPPAAAPPAAAPPAAAPPAAAPPAAAPRAPGHQHLDRPRTLHLSGPRHAVAEAGGYLLRVTRRHSHTPVEGAHVRAIGTRGFVPTDRKGEVRLQFAGAGTKRLVAYHDHGRSNVIVVHVREDSHR